jgi:ribosome-associated protein
MLAIDDRVLIPEDEFEWSYVRSGGPGGQNVNKVASKAVLRWDLAGSPSLPEEVKVRLRAQQPGRITGAGELILSSQRFRDQERNRQDCLEKLGAMIRQALVVPRPRKKTKPSRGARQARLRDKRHRATAKAARRKPGAED